ncbi:MAG: 4Fe-4S binding protein [Planctomycetota bacterium]|jgi:polyferredoxin
MFDEKKDNRQLPTDGRQGLKEHSKRLRPVIQTGFVVFSILLCLQFRSFVLSLTGPVNAPIKARPPAVEAYLPISSLMSLTYLVKTGVANLVHPAGLVIFTVTLVLALLIRRGFCSWVCPIGTAAEWAHKTGKNIFGRNFLMPRWLDVILRSLKYGLLGFFLYHILLMPAVALRQFIYGPYNRIADVKMYLLFSNIGVTTLSVILVLGLLSVLFKNFLCRYLCPYGALLGLFSALSPVAVRRDSNKCIGCGKCGRLCPNQIPVDKKKMVRSVECTACFSCIGVCRTPGAIGISLPREKMRVSVVAYGVIMIATFFFAGQVGRTLNYWKSETTAREYKFLYSRINQTRHP